MSKKDSECSIFSLHILHVDAELDFLELTKVSLEKIEKGKQRIPWYNKDRTCCRYDQR